MIITIFGGGNIGTLMAAEFAIRGHEIRMFTSRPEWQRSIDIYDSNDNLIGTGRLADITNNIERAMANVEMILITYPTCMLKDAANLLLPYVGSGLAIGVVPGNDAEFFFQKHVSKGATLFGLQRVHSIARLKKRGESVYMLGRKPRLEIAVLPSSKTTAVADIAAKLFDMPTTTLPNYLITTLTPSNPILHTARLYCMFRDWKPGITYDRNMLFYETWDDESSNLLLACDAELQQLCRTLEAALDIDLSAVKSLKEHYESPCAQAMTDKISHIPAFKGIESPMKESKPDEWEPDFESRYFKSDFAFGLKAIKDIAALVEVPVPSINKVFDWYAEISNNQTMFDKVPSSLDELASIYR